MEAVFVFSWVQHGYNILGIEHPATGMAGKGKVDYVLWGSDGKPLSVMEAKRTKSDAQRCQRQAELCANCLESTTGQPRYLLHQRLRQQLSLPKTNLILETARLFGYARLGAKVPEAMLKGLKIGAEKGIADVSDERVYTKNKV